MAFIGGLKNVFFPYGLIQSRWNKTKSTGIYQNHKKSKFETILKISRI